MPPDVRAIAGVDDSKQLVAAERERLAVKIRERAVSIGIGAASVREIDRREHLSRDGDRDAPRARRDSR